MANLGKKGDTFCVRFRFQGKEYKKSLKTKDEPAARGALHLIEFTLHRLHTGQIRVPEQVDAGDYVVSGGTLREPQLRAPAAGPVAIPATRELARLFTNSQKNLVAESYLDSQAMHLRHLLSTSGNRPTLRETSSPFAILTATFRTDWLNAIPTQPNANASLCCSFGLAWVCVQHATTTVAE